MKRERERERVKTKWSEHRIGQTDRADSEEKLGERESEGRKPEMEWNSQS